MTGPATCGKTADGSQVLVNSGSISCVEAIRVATNSNGADPASGPKGWDCSNLAVRNDTTGAPGYACVGIKSLVRISVIVPEPPEPAAGKGEEGCNGTYVPPSNGNPGYCAGGEE